MEVSFKYLPEFAKRAKAFIASLVEEVRGER